MKFDGDLSKTHEMDPHYCYFTDNSILSNLWSTILLHFSYHINANYTNQTLHLGPNSHGDVLNTYMEDENLLLLTHFYKEVTSLLSQIGHFTLIFSDK